MSSPDRQWWEVRAGEYVLGTLDAKERELFVRIVRHDTDLQRSVAAWEARLAPLDEATPARAPPGHLWAAIRRQLRDGSALQASMTVSPIDDDSLSHIELHAAADDDWLAPSPAGSGASAARVDTPADPSAGRPAGTRAGTQADRPAADADVVPLRAPPPRGLVVPFVAAFATAASLILGVLLHQQGERLDSLQAATLQADGVSVILGEDGAPLWLVQADFDSERVRVTSLAPPPDGGGGDYQLWQVLPDGGGVAPVSLLPENDGVSSEIPVPGLARRFDAFAVSLEPNGGSPEPTPTGAVLFQGGVTYAGDEGDGS